MALIYLFILFSKIYNALAESKSTQRCHICGATSKDFNDMTKWLIGNNNTEFTIRNTNFTWLDTIFLMSSPIL